MLKGLPATANPQPNPALQSEVSKVPAMCGAPEPPVSEVQTTAASIVNLCAAATGEIPSSLIAPELQSVDIFSWCFYINSLLP